jgi:GT2 family glycosyltransferase
MTDAAEVDPLMVSFVVPTYRRPEVLRATLTALLDVDYPADRYEVIVVDDGSADATPEVVAALQPAAACRLAYIHQENSGVATARNRGARSARGELLIFVDDDIVVEPTHVRDHLAARDGRGEAVVNGHWEFPPALVQAFAATPFGRFRLAVERWVKEGISKEPLPDGRESPSAVTACNLAIGRTQFWELGGFDEGFPFAGYEDQELSYRARRTGSPLVYDRRIRLIHNDQRVTLSQFCERQRRGACTAVYLARRHPEAYGSAPLVIENGPVTRSDPAPRVLKKLLKRALTWPPALVAVHAGVAVMERVAPTSRVLQRAYWFVCGLHIFRGVRDGYAAPAPAPPLVRDVSACP